MIHWCSKLVSFHVEGFRMLNHDFEIREIGTSRPILFELQDIRFKHLKINIRWHCHFSFYCIFLRLYGENSITSIKWPFALQQCAFKHTSILPWTSYSSFLSRIVLYICGLVKYHVCMKYVVLWVNTTMHVLYQMNNECTVDHLPQKSNIFQFSLRHAF